MYIYKSKCKNDFGESSCGEEFIFYEYLKSIKLYIVVVNLKS